MPAHTAPVMWRGARGAVLAWGPYNIACRLHVVGLVVSHLPNGFPCHRGVIVVWEGL